MNEVIKQKILDSKKLKLGECLSFKNKIELDFLYMSEMFTDHELRDVSTKRSYHIYTHNKNFFLYASILLLLIGVYANVDNFIEFYSANQFSKILIMEIGLLVMFTLLIIPFFRRKFLIINSEGISFGVRSKVKKRWNWNAIKYVYYRFIEYDESVGSELVILIKGGREDKIDLGSSIQFRELGKILYAFMKAYK